VLTTIDGRALIPASSRAGNAEPIEKDRFGMIFIEKMRSRSNAPITKGEADASFPFALRRRGELDGTRMPMMRMETCEDRYISG